MLALLFTICMIWFVGKFVVFGLKASWGIMKLLCTVIFFPVILYGFGRTDVHCFSVVDCRWHYSIGSITFIVDREAKTNGV